MNGLKEDKVSIITPTYNSQEHIGKTIESIQAQTYGNWELLITDDYSTDATVDIIYSFQKNDSRIKLYRLKKNQGPGVARNNSIKQSSGRFIAFCDSDDQWRAKKLEKQISFMKNNKLAFSCTTYEVIDETGKKIRIDKPPKQLNYKLMLYNNYVGCLTVIYDTNILGKQYMPKIRKRQDWVLWLKIFQKIGQTQALDENLAIYLDRSTSISSNKLIMFKYNWMVYRNELGFNIIKSFVFLIIFTFFYVKKRLF